MNIKTVLILAAGRGTRLKPFTNNLPKCLLPIGNTNILRNLIEQSEKYLSGVKIYVNVSYLAEKIINEINNFQINRRPHIIWEQNPLGPALTVTNHCNKINGNVLVLHGDLFFSDLTFSQIIYSITQRPEEASILFCHQRSRQNARSIVSETGGVIKSIFEASISVSAKNIDISDDEVVWSSSGVMVVKSASLSNFKPEMGLSISPTLINYIAGHEKLYLEKCNGTRVSIDDEKSYLAAIEISQKSEKLFDRTLRQ